MGVRKKRRSAYRTPPQISNDLSVGHDKVLGWIHSGELQAVNLAARRDGRPRWRISDEDLEDFLARRAASPAPKRRRRRKQPNHVTDYY